MLRGYELVGVNEIIEKSQVAKTTFYKYFRSKRLLCEEWLKAEWRASEKRNEIILSNDSELSERIAAKYRALEESMMNHSFRGCPFSNTKVMLSDSKIISQLIVDYKDYSRNFWIQVAHEACKPDEFGDVLFLLYSGATVEAQNSLDLWPLQSALSASLKMTNN